MITISGQEVKIVKNSLSIDDAIEERTTCSFIVIDFVGVHYSKGEPVTVVYDGVTVFAGVIEKPKEKKEVVGNTLYHTISCIDYHYLADKRTIAKSYQNMSAGDIVNDIITNYLSTEGVTTFNIQSGPTVTEAVFNYVRISDALDSLAEKAGYWWKIDFNKGLHFVARETNTAPFSVSSADMEKDSISLENGNPKYRNRQYIRGGKDITDPYTETPNTDGKTRSFPLGFPVAKVPTITVNGVTQTVGIKGVQTDKEFYWSKGDSIITQDDNEPVLASSDILEVTYQGEFSIVVLAENPEEVMRRKDMEGGTGYVEDVVDEPYNSDRASAFQSANAKLEKYGVIGRRLQFRTWKAGLEPGQLVTVDLPIHNLNQAEMLIESVTVTREDHQTFYSIAAVEGPVSGSWAKMFYQMATRGQAFVLRENIEEDEVLIILDQLSKTWVSTEDPNIFKEVYPSDSLYTSSSLFPMFDFDQRVKYLSLYDANGEFFRKKISKQTGEDTSQIVSTTFIASFEANQQITEVGWWGGHQATAAVGTGVEVDRQPYSKVKSQLEALQIDKTDTKGW